MASKKKEEATKAAAKRKEVEDVREVMAVAAPRRPAPSDAPVGSRLFRVSDSYFANKKDAKQYRDNGAPNGSCVSKGPDHFLYGVMGHPRTTSARKNKGRFTN